MLLLAMMLKHDLNALVGVRGQGKDGDNEMGESVSVLVVRGSSRLVPPFGLLL